MNVGPHEGLFFDRDIVVSLPAQSGYLLLARTPFPIVEKRPVAHSSHMPLLAARHFNVFAARNKLVDRILEGDVIRIGKSGEQIAA